MCINLLESLQNATKYTIKRDMKKKKKKDKMQCTQVNKCLRNMLVRSKTTFSDSVIVNFSPEVTIYSL